ncbi:MAG: HAMP domain-containing sensor histidine kinase [Myxococcota bacterium]
MAFLDEIRSALRRPPGVEAAPPTAPAALVERCRREVYDLLRDAPHDALAVMWAHRKWADPVDLRDRAARVWRAASEGLFGAASDADRFELVVEAVRRQLGAPGAVPRTAFVEAELARLQGVAARDPAADWTDPPRYLVELGALDWTGTRRTPLGALLAELGVRELVLGLLHAEACQSTGEDDPFRLPRWVFDAMARRTPLADPYIVPWPRATDRLFALGMLGSRNENDPEGYYLPERDSWFADVADPRSPLGILVRSTLDDQAAVSTGGRASSEREVRAIAELVAHELGNALVPLALTVEQLGRELTADHRHVVRLGTLTARLQQFASSIDRLVPAGEPVAVVGLIDVAHDALAGTAAERNGHLVVRLELSETVLSGRRRRLQLAFENLIRNAAQAAHAAHRSARLWIRDESGPDGPIVTFEDDGPGVPSALAATLFDRGVSGRGTTGLGLALVREIATEHGGAVHHEQRPGGGARFVLRLRGA